MLAGTFTGNARSAAAVLGGMLGGQRGYFDAASAVSSAVGDPRDRSSMAFFDYYIQGVEVLEHTPSGARGNFDRDYADAVVKSDPTKFCLVPPSQYRTTD